MRRPTVARRLALGCCIFLGCWNNGDATTSRSLSFSEIATRADAVLEATVLNVEVISTGRDLRRTRPEGETPSSRPPTTEDDDLVSRGAAGTPLEVPTEGGRMLFSLYTLSVDNLVAGTADSTIRLKLAGGVGEGMVVTVHGMPRLEVGKRYFLFLRKGFETVADPIVGINQGFFEIAEDGATGGEVLVDGNGDFLIGVEEDRFVVRANPARARGAMPQLGPAPVPDSPDQATSRISPGVARYWLSEEPPMTPRQLADSVLATRAGVR